MKRLNKPPKNRRTFATLWDELDYVCRKIDYWLYDHEEGSSAVRHLDHLGRLLRTLPENDEAIIRHEALALFHELKGEWGLAIPHREREIASIEKLQAELDSEEHDNRTKAYILRHRDAAGLRKRKALLKELKKRLLI